MQHLPVLSFLLLLATPVIAQDVPMGCYVREYSDDHLVQHPEQVVDRISIMFAQDDWVVTADVQVLLANQGHAKRDGYGGMRVSEFAGSFNGPLRFGVECDGGYFDVIANDTSGILIETRYLRLTSDGCGGDGIDTTLAETSPEATRYRLDRADDAACQW